MEILYVRYVSSILSPTKGKKQKKQKQKNSTRLGDGDPLLLHCLQQRVWVASHLVKLVDAARALVRQHQSARLQRHLAGSPLLAKGHLLFADRHGGVCLPESTTANSNQKLCAHGTHLLFFFFF